MNKEQKRAARCVCLKILYANSSSGVLFDEILDNDDIFESENSYCEWGNTDKTYVNCDYFINADLSQGDYTLVTVGDCHYEHDEDDVETLVCNNGHYNHTLVQDGEEDDMTNIQGDVHEDSPITDFAHKTA